MMIPAIATMVGAYIITRMVLLVRDETDRARGASVGGILGALTIVVVSVSVGYVWYLSHETGQALAESIDILRGSLRMNP